MAILILGKTRCPLCELVLVEGDDIVNFPALFFNQRRAVWEVNDSAVHRECLLERPYAEQALAKLNEFKSRLGTPRICRACGLPITSPDNFFATGPLADDPEEPVAEISWLQVHASCLATWEETDWIVEILRSVSRSNTWEGVVLEGLLDRIATVRSSEGGREAPTHLSGRGFSNDSVHSAIASEIGTTTGTSSDGRSPLTRAHKRKPAGRYGDAPGPPSRTVSRAGGKKDLLSRPPTRSRRR